MQIIERQWGFEGSLYPEFRVGEETICWINTDEWTLEMVADRDLTSEEERYLIEWRAKREAKAAPPLPAKPAATTPDTIAGGMRLRIVPDGVSAHKYANQLVKARALAEFLRKHGMSKDDALLMTCDMWRTVAKLAGVREPSATSQLLTIENLAWMERVA